MTEYQIIISTDNGTSTQFATGDIHILAFVKNALEEVKPGRIMLLIEEDKA